MDKKTSQLTELLKADVTNDDVLAIVNAAQSKKIKISTIFSLVTDMINAAISAFQQSFGILVLSASTTLSSTLGTAFTKIQVVDSTAFDISNGSMAHDFVNFNTTILKDGIYDLSLFSSLVAPQNSVITLARYKNDQPIAGATLEFIGNGTKRVTVNGELYVQLSAGDVIDVRAKADTAAVDLDVLAAQLRIEKTHH